MQLLDRQTGGLVWEWNSGGAGFVVLLLEQDCLAAAAAAGS